jgi:predicted solute-binding protein
MTASIAGKRVAVPGMMTSAYLALRLYQPDFVPVVVPSTRSNKPFIAVMWTPGC